MPQPPTTAAATAAAAASATPGGGAPILSAWLVVRRRSLFSFPKRRYVTLTDDHVLLVDSTPVLHLVDCVIQSNPASKTIDLIPAPSSGVAVRIIADSPFQYSKWNASLQTSANTVLERHYKLDLHALLGVGVHGIVRRALPEPPFREHSIDSNTTSSDYSLHQPHLRNIAQNFFKSRPPNSSSRNSIDLDPDSVNNNEALRDYSIPASKADKRLLRQMSNQNLPDDDDGAIDHTAHPASVAVKTVSRNANGPVTVASEILCAKAKLHHPAIVRTLDLFETVEEIHVVMEECLGPNLGDFVQKYGPFVESRARDIFVPILKAVGYMHACGIAHWDICPANVMFANEDPTVTEPKIFDFGTARPIDPANGRVPTECGIFQEKGKIASLACASPELLTSKAHRYAAKSDMWQLGCVLYFLLIGRLPFSGRNGQDFSVASTILAFCKERSSQRERFLFDPEFVSGLILSTEARQLILKLLCPNPRMRPNTMQCLRDSTFLASRAGR